MGLKQSKKHMANYPFSEDYNDSLYNIIIKNFTDRLGNCVYQIKSITKKDDCVEVILNDSAQTKLKFTAEVVKE